MTRETAVLIMIAAALIILVLMVWGWRRRTKRDGGLQVSHEVPTDARDIAVFSGFYVATTENGQPLNRLALPGMKFRARARIIVSDRGVLIDMPGEVPAFIAASAVESYGTATWTIDRVVEAEGLLALTWRVADEVLADTYLRLQDATTTELIAALDEMSASTTTGVA